jgi:hypothetical protein
MLMKKLMGGAIAMTVALGGCATSFTGSPHVEDGRAGCEKKCKGQGMEVAGMVYMGEYSSACVCEVPGQSASNRRLLMAGAAATGGGAVAVETQRRAAQRSQQN